MADRKLRVFINGLGVMGKDFFRVIEEYGNGKIQVVGGNDAHPNFTAENLAYQLNFDTIYRNFRRFVIGVDKPPINFSEEPITYDRKKSIGSIWFTGVDGLDKTVPVFREINPERLPYRELEVDLVYDCTGHYLTRDLAQKQIDAGAKIVHLSGPPEKDKSIIPTIPGYNDKIVDYKSDKISSGGSCTTTCLVTVVATLHEKFNLIRASAITYHAYTNDQNTQDGWNKAPERSRAAAESYKYAKTGAAQMIGRVIPDLEGRIGVEAIRGSHPAVSLLNLAAEFEKNPTAEEINQFLISVAHGDIRDEFYQGLVGRLGVTDLAVTSGDIIGNPFSALVELRATKATDDNRIANITAHYDNVRMFTIRQKELMENHAHHFVNEK